jgi:hypothetical protein
MAARVLPRPRDILYLTNAALEVAVRHRHSKVSATDILDAEKQYSQFAFEALLVEAASGEDASGEPQGLDDDHNGALPTGASGASFETLLYEFVGAEETISLGEITEALIRAGVTDAEEQRTNIDHLIGLSFLGQEVRSGEYEFAEDSRQRRRMDGLAARLAAREGRDPSFQIHPAYQPYLEVSAATSAGQRRLPLTRP